MKKISFKNKRALEMSFAWIFAIIVGAIIIISAIYIAGKFIIPGGQYRVNTETAKQITNALEPLQTSVEEIKSDSLTLVSDTKLYTSCNLNDEFGENRLEISERSGFNKKWTERGGDISSKNYIFAENEIETSENNGKVVYFIVKKLDMPFKTADIISMYTEKYCFVSPPEIIEDEINALNFKDNKTNIELKNSLSICDEQSVKVCFNSNQVQTSCEIIVSCNNFECNNGYVKKLGNENNEGLYFTSSLVYGAIFSSKENYECNVQRIIKRLNELSKVYLDKAAFVSGKGCNTGLNADIATLIQLTNKLDIKKIESQLPLIELQARVIEDKNKPENLICQLF
ncbi:hypothetical protein HYW74_00720 [Candidatus Pacearchaeota archaeon]|nr:hypothetical protein [Candidatus Pacearchaeota archaeon]